VIPAAADCFQPRSGVADLDAAAEVPALVLSGLGGVGKTQLAARYARRLYLAGELDLLVWVSAANRTAVVTGYAQAARDVAADDSPDGETGADRFLAWLARTDRRWLVVLDDLAEPGDLSRGWPPDTRTGRVLVTTRRRDAALAGNGRRLVQVGLFTPAEALGYLSDKLAVADGRLVEAAELAADLGHLPLALAQAAAYLIDRGLDCVAYRRRFAQRRRLADLVPETGALPDDHQATVARTWSLSVDLADQLAPAGLARPLLELAGVLDPNGIPVAVFTTPAVLADLSAVLSGAAEPSTAYRPPDAEAARDALRCLHRLSLVDYDSAGAAVRVHALVQRATRDSTAANRVARVVAVAADALLVVWPDVERDAALAQSLRANAEALIAYGNAVLWTPEPHPLLFRYGRSMCDAGLVGAGVGYWQTVAATAEQRLGFEHPDTLAARGNLAQARGMAGDPAGAAAAFAELLADRTRVLGTDHRHTLICRGNLAYWQGEAGDAAGAASAFAELVTDHTRVLGPRHPQTLAVRGNLSRWQGEGGDPAAAAEALAQLLPDQLALLGPDHPHTMTTRVNLAYWRGEAGDAAGAAVAFAELLSDHLRVFGRLHPHTLVTRSHLARWRGEAGDPAGAVAILQEVLADRTRVLGPDHPQTMAARGNLAQWRGEAGDPAAAVAMLEELLADRIRILGPDHHRTVLTRTNLAEWRSRRVG
jgi:tetratricopeptide repeat protein/NB-ARC domain-containing protein